MAKSTKKQAELDGMPQPDECAQLALELHEANCMIAEGNEKREEVQERLAAALISSSREKVTILCEDESYRTFRLKKLKAVNKIVVKKEKRPE